MLTMNMKVLHPDPSLREDLLSSCGNAISRELSVVVFFRVCLHCRMLPCPSSIPSSQESLNPVTGQVTVTCPGKPEFCDWKIKT